ncbi:MAG: response regulator [Anaerolineae bacterium]|nr:response regulator [Anaerolineae bacterium]
MKPWMVVEDEPDIRNIVKFMFESWGHPALEFADGHQAFKWLDSIEEGSYNGELPELALMDIRMPGPRGNDIARRMRTVGAVADIPIILMTAFALTDAERNALYEDCGVDYVMHKPLPDYHKLKELLDSVYEGRADSGSEAKK